MRRDIIIVFEPVDDTSMTATIEYEGAHVEMTITGDMPLARRLLDTLRDPNLPLARWLEAAEECRRAHRDTEVRLARETTLLTCPECGRGVRPAYAVAGMCGECATAEIEALRSRRKIDYYAAKRENKKRA